MNQNLLGIITTVTVLLVSIPKIAEAIVDGKPAVNGQFPWAIALYLDDSYVCTASLISHNTVLTAAHCVVLDGKTESASSFYGMIGDVNRNSPNATRIEFSKVTPHPDYNATNLENDIAVFQTRDEVLYTNTIGRVCIAKASTQKYQYKNATAMGWGRVSTGGELPEILMYLEQMVQSHIECKAELKVFYKQGIHAADTRLCTKELKRERNGICDGDSGGPLVHLSRNMPPVQIGVISYISGTYGCGTRIIPSVSTKISVYVDFIMEASEEDDGICTQ